MEISEYMSMLLGGLFGLSCIAVTIFSILGSKIQEKVLNTSIISLQRYNILVIFYPLYILIFCVGLMMFLPNIYNNIEFAYVLTVYLVFVISVQAFAILEPLYKIESFKKTLIENKLKEFTKKQRNKNYREVEKNIIEDLSKIILEFKSTESEFTLNDMVIIYFKYLQCKIQLNEDSVFSKEFTLAMMSIGFDIFDKAFLRMIDKCGFDMKYIVEELIKRQNKEFCKEETSLIFNGLYQILEDDRINNISVDDINGFNQLFIKYIRIVFAGKSDFEYVIEALYDEKWNKKDCDYLMLYVKNIIKMCNAFPSLLDKIESPNKEKVKYILDCYNDESKFGSSNDISIDFIERLKTMFVLIRKEEADVKKV